MEAIVAAWNFEANRRKLPRTSAIAVQVMTTWLLRTAGRLREAFAGRRSDPALVARPDGLFVEPRIMARLRPLAIRFRRNRMRSGLRDFTLDDRQKCLPNAVAGRSHGTQARARSRRRAANNDQRAVMAQQCEAAFGRDECKTPPSQLKDVEELQREPDQCARPAQRQRKTKRDHCDRPLVCDRTELAFDVSSLQHVNGIHVWNHFGDGSGRCRRPCRTVNLI